MEKIDCNCKNCNVSVDGKFCSNCGQATKTGRIDLHYLIHEIQHSLLHVDKGIFYTIKELALRPAEMIKDYLAGKRINHFKPIAFVIILGTIYGFVALFFEYFPDNELSQSLYSETGTNPEDMKDLSHWLHGHYSMVMLAFLPFAALSSFLVFRKKGYNYFEHLVIYAYITGMQILLLLIVYPINYNFHSNAINALTFLPPYIYIIWVLSTIFKRKSWASVIIKSILSIFLGMILLFIVTTIIIFILVILGIYKV